MGRTIFKNFHKNSFFFGFEENNFLMLFEFAHEWKYQVRDPDGRTIRVTLVSELASKLGKG